MKKQRLSFAIGLVMLAAVLGACATPSKPSVTLRPIAGQIIEGKEFTFQSSSSDVKGITLVEFLVDNEVAIGAKIEPPQKAIVVPYKWMPVSGDHMISVRAVNSDNVSSDDAAVVVSVSMAPEPAPTAAATSAAPTVAPKATAVLPSPTPGTAGCVNNAKFVSDVTVPDGTRFQPNQRFEKTWRIQNTGTCTWNSKYSLVFSAGEFFGGTREVAVPINVSSLNIVDLGLPMTAPAAYGVHEARWQLRDPNGALFGVFLININVINPQPTPCVPQISSFTVDRPTINKGESTVLRWGGVANAQHVEIDNGIGGVGTPGTHTVAPAQTTTFNLRASCGGNTIARSVTVLVNQPAPPQPTSVPPQPVRRNVSGSWHGGDYVIELSEAMGCSGSDCGVRGSVTHNALPAPETDPVSGSINVYNGSMSLAVERPGAGGISCNVDASSSHMSCSGFFGSITFSK